MLVDFGMDALSCLLERVVQSCIVLFVLLYVLLE